jgi:hypothetical protein
MQDHRFAAGPADRHASRRPAGELLLRMDSLLILQHSLTDTIGGRPLRHGEKPYLTIGKNMMHGLGVTPRGAMARISSI